MGEHASFWDNDVTLILMLLRVLKSRQKFDNVVKSLIVFGKVINLRQNYLYFCNLFSSLISSFLQLSSTDPTELVDEKNIHPHIIAISSQIDQKTKYYISLQNRLMSVCLLLFSVHVLRFSLLFNLCFLIIFILT